jgi:proteasome lid subunit RPN8/RPN11
MADNKLIVARRVWLDGLAELCRRGGMKHEAGAFLLGTQDGGRRVGTKWVFYDDLDPHAYATGICILHADAFDRLWRLCREAGLTVVADIHTHPGSPQQSSSDRANPMVALAGHLALIVPNYAQGPHWRHRLGVYRYEGSHKWTDLGGWRARTAISTGTFR